MSHPAIFWILTAGAATIGCHKVTALDDDDTETRAEERDRYRASNEVVAAAPSGAPAIRYLSPVGSPLGNGGYQKIFWSTLSTSPFSGSLNQRPSRSRIAALLLARIPYVSLRAPSWT